MERVTGAGRELENGEIMICLLPSTQRGVAKAEYLHNHLILVRFMLLYTGRNPI